MTTKIDLTNIADTALTTLTGPKITTIVYTGDDTATDTAGGQTINLTGNGFQSGCSVLVASTASSVVTFISATQISFVAPALAAGTYVIYVINPDGGTAISIPGISYSGTPNWTTAAGSLGTAYETGSISATLTATGDAPITYTLVTGTLPPGSSLNSNGTLSGTAAATASATTYSFTIKASDAQNQDTNRAFSITINPDVVTWSSPANSTTYEVSKDIAIANVAMSATSASGQNITYTADTLPTGLSITGANIAGTPTVAASTTTTLTATASVTNRLATRTINWVVSIANDTYFKNTTLLLNGETTVTPFISDASTNSFGLTIVGDTKPTLFNPYTPGYYSNYFDGTGDYLNAPANTAFAFSTGDYTLEFWVYSIIAWSGTICLYNNNSGGYFLQYAAGTGLQTGVAGSSSTGTYATTLTANAWNHIAVSRASGSSKCFVNGTQVGTTVSDTTNYAQNGAYIGALYNGSQPLTGYISNLRVVKGTAVYTTTFTPPTSPLTSIANTSLLTCQSNRLIDNSTNTFTITKNGDVSVSSAIPFTANSSYSTYGSAYLDGTGDYLTTASNAAFTYGTSNFTIEGWHYLTAAASATKYLFDQRVSGNGLFPAIYVSSGSYIVYINSGVALTAGVVTSNAWVHWALVKNSSTTTLYINGTSAGSFADTNNYSTTALFRIGSEWSLSGSYDWQGYMSDVRIVKGTAVYTTAFTPPTSPLTAIANTSLLTLQYNGGATNQAIIDNSNFNNIITRVGNTSQGSFSPYSVTGWSNYFDGTGDYLILSGTPANFGTGDFLIEGWIYMTGTGGGYPQFLSANGTTDLQFAFNSNTSIYFFPGGTTYSASHTFALNTWYHVAWSRVSGTMRIFVDGVQKTSFSYSSAINLGTALIGGYAGGTANGAFQGYISNLRVLVGTGVTTITVSTTPLTAIANTSLLTCQSNRLIDNSINNFTLTRNGDVSVQALDPFGSIPEAVPISYSVYFDGTGDYLQLSDNVAVDLGTDNFTIECWFMRTATPTVTYHGIVGGNGSGFNAWSLYYTNGNEIMMFNSAGTIQITTGASIANNIWYHVAVVKNTGVLKIFVNGVERYSAADVAAYNITANGWRIGDDGSHANGWMNGYISNLRIVKGTAVYTSTFTPSTTPLTAIANTSLLTCQSTTMIDNSTNRFTLTANGNVVPRIFNPFGYTAQSATSYTPSLHGGSAYFDGTGDYASIAPSPLFTYTGDFTMEAWVYPTSLSADNSIISRWTSSLSFIFKIVSGGRPYLATFPNSVVTQGTTTAVIINQWNHVAVTRTGSTVKLFVNGVQDATTGSHPGALNSSNTAITVGSLDTTPSQLWTGYLSDVKVVNGTALYTSSFVPPTTPVTSTINTVLLLNFNNGGIVDQHGTNVLETVGNAQLSTSVKKYNNSSMYFDGTGDYLTFAPTQATAFGTGDFTIEFWVYPITQVGTYPGLFGNQSFTANSFIGYDRHLGYPTKFSVYCYNYTSGGAMLVSTTTVSINTWYHIAITRSGNNFRLFVNGTVEATVTFAGSVDGGVPLRYIGSDYATNPFAGYLDDFRITKGYARYTSNFTAPTSALITK